GNVTYTLYASDFTFEQSGTFPIDGPSTITAPAGDGQFVMFSMNTAHGNPCTSATGANVPVNGTVDVYFGPTCVAGSVTTQTFLDAVPLGWSTPTQMSVHLHNPSNNFDAFVPATPCTPPYTCLQATMTDVPVQDGLTATFSAITATGITCTGTSIL